VEGFQSVTGPVLVAAFGLLIVVAMVLYWRRKDRTTAAAWSRDEIATIVERVYVTGWGVFWGLVLALDCTISIVASMAATTIFQQIAAGVSLIGGAVIAGLGVALGRRRTYTVYRSRQD